VGGGTLVGDRALMLRVGVGLLDRVTGTLRSFTEGREESIAVTTIRPDGAICTANSPVRRASGKALNPEIADLIGGISCYKPVRNDLLARDATCAAGMRARNASTIADSEPASADQDIRQIQVLIDQSRAAISRAVSDDDLDADSAASLNAALDDAEGNLSRSRLSTAANDLLKVCNALPAD